MPRDVLFKNTRYVQSEPCKQYVIFRCLYKLFFLEMAFSSVETKQKMYMGIFLNRSISIFYDQIIKWKLLRLKSQFFKPFNSTIFRRQHLRRRSLHTQSPALFIFDCSCKVKPSYISQVSSTTHKVALRMPSNKRALIFNNFFLYCFP